MNHCRLCHEQRHPDGNAHEAPGNEGKYPPPRKRMVQFPDGIALVDDAVTSNQHRRLRRREDMKPHRRNLQRKNPEKNNYPRSKATPDPTFLAARSTMVWNACFIVRLLAW
jgi:hypothetical protein